MKKQIVIIEDELAASIYLEKIIKNIDSDFNIQSVLGSVEQSIAWFKNNNHPDLLFVDIQLSDGLSFNIFNEIDIRCPIIFTTAYDKYAIQAFELNSIGYLLKPITEEDILKVLNKFNKNELLINNNESLRTMFDDILGELSRTKYKKNLLVQIKDKIIPIETDSIIKFLTHERKVKVFTHNDKEYFIDFNMEEIQKILDPSKFFRVNRQIIINKEFIKDVTIWFGGKLVIYLKNHDSERIEVSKSKVGEFKNWLMY